MYRIKTVQNRIDKLLEKIVARWLAIQLEKDNLVPLNLGSYRSWRDTCANASVPASDVMKGLKGKRRPWWLHFT